MTRVWLSRRRNGNYLLTKARPKKSPIHGTPFEDYYVPYGDPIGLDNCCPWGVKLIFGVELDISGQCLALVEGKAARNPLEELEEVIDREEPKEMETEQRTI